MKSVSRKHIVAASCLILLGCATVPPSAPNITESALIASELATVPEADRLNVAPAVATEIGVRFRCPASQQERTLLTFLRMSFDQLLRPRVLPATGLLVDRLRHDANEACGIIPS